MPLYGALPFVPPTAIPSGITVANEYPPLRLSINVKPASGPQERWSTVETLPNKVHQALSFSTTMPGGFENADMTLTRDPRREFPDLQELETLTVYSVGGSVIWQGRLETVPSVSGDSLSITPGAVGFQAALTDNSSVREIYAETDLTKWSSPSNSRQLVLALSNYDYEGASTVADPTGSASVVTQMTGDWARPHLSEAWYDAQGAALGKLVYGWQLPAANKIGDLTSAQFTWAVWLMSDDAGGVSLTPSTGGTYTITALPATEYDSSGYISSPGPSAQGIVNARYGYKRTYAVVQMQNATGVTGTSGVSYPIYWGLALYGDQNIPLYDIPRFDLTGNPLPALFKGVLGSDVLSHAISKYVPELAISSQGVSTIQPSTFVIPQLTFFGPATPNDVIQGVTAYELQDWAVWEGPTFYWNERGARGKKWRARVGPAKLRQAGPQVDRLWNGVCVFFSDVAGIARSVGPPGSGANWEDVRLLDSDPQNPINELGLKKWAPVSMGTTDPEVAKQVGIIFLAEQRIRDTAGSAQLSGYVEDDKGIIWPAFCVRAGDTIVFVDSGDDPGARRIINTSYNDETRVNSITLDSPPDSLQAVLGRLQARVGSTILQ